MYCLSERFLPPGRKTNTSTIKGAVCRILTLKHKNTMIFLQIFNKHDKLTYLFI